MSSKTKGAILALSITALITSAGLAEAGNLRGCYEKTKTSAKQLYRNPKKWVKENKKKTIGAGMTVLTVVAACKYPAARKNLMSKASGLLRKTTRQGKRVKCKYITRTYKNKGIKLPKN